MALLSEDEIRAQLPALAGWERAGLAIRRVYAFKDFKEAMAFVNRVAERAEALDHHPDILINYNKVTLTSTSHDSGGLTLRDFRLAKAIDA